MKKIFGYARVSSKDQNLDRQIRILKEYVNLEQDIFTDKKSGKDTHRTNYQKMKTMVRQDDIIVCTELDRFARSKQDIKNELEYFKKEGIKVVFLDIPTTKIFLSESNSFDQVNDIFDMVNNILIEVIATIAEKERKKIKERQLQGIEEAQRKGIKFGRPKKINLKDPETKKKVLKLIEKVENKEIKNREASELLSISTRYFYTLKKNLNDNTIE
jgi:DNA invertase Pin-like site-specific DNA recombinase